KFAEPGEFAPVSIGGLSVWPPVVLAPMAGVTNYPFRFICKEFGAGLFVSEMINARPLVEGSDKTLRLADFGPGELPRSLQLYGTDPYYVAEAVKRLVNEGRVDHLDMNFGCPVHVQVIDTARRRRCHSLEAEFAPKYRAGGCAECPSGAGHNQIPNGN